jgi:hypothetical protein
MSQVTMNIIDRDRAIHGQPHGSFVETVVASLAAEPETIEELEAALARFLPPDERGYFAGWRTGICNEPYDAGICIIDLAARLVVTKSTYCTPRPKGMVAYHDPRRGEEVGLRYHVSEDWMFCGDAESWEGTAAHRRRERLAAPPLDVRQVLYDRVSAFIVDECFGARGDTVRSGDWTPPSGWALRILSDRAKSGDTPTSADAIAEIHARWLTTPREDLRGQSPRDVLLAKRNHIEWDMQDRCGQWSLLRECPPGLGRQSAAFRYGGFGMHEIVLYYELVRHLICDCWDHIVERDVIGPTLPTQVDEVVRLGKVQTQWLDSPQNEYLSEQSASEVIEHERMRIPEADTGHSAMVDDDCPLCQMMADGDFGPMFWHLDGCNMDDDFPFSFYRTRAEWDEERRRMEECECADLERQLRAFAEQLDPDVDWNDNLPF